MAWPRRLLSKSSSSHKPNIFTGDRRGFGGACGFPLLPHAAPLLSVFCCSQRVPVSYSSTPANVSVDNCCHPVGNHSSKLLGFMHGGKMHGALVILLAVVSFLAEGAWALQERHGAPQLVARQDTSDRGTATSTGATPSSSPILFFDTVSQLTSCMSGTIDWVYEGPTGEMALTITNLGIPQNGAPSSTPTDTSTNSLTDLPRRAVPSGASDNPFTITISTTIEPHTGSFTWASVAVPAGWYVIYASLTQLAFVQRSTSFYVSQGVDTSCLSASSVTTSASSTGTGASSTTTSAPDNSGSVAPVGGSSSSHSNTLGIVLGVVITVVVLLLGALGAYFLMRRRWARPGPNGESPFANAEPRDGFKGLTSVDSTKPKRGSKKLYAGGALQSHHSQTGSIGPILGAAQSVDGFPPSEEKISSTSTPGHGSAAVASPFDDPADGDLELTGVPGLARHGSTGRRRYSYTSSMGYSDYGGRRPSVQEAVVLPLGARRPSVDSTTYPPSPSPAYPSGTSGNMSPTVNTQQGYYSPYPAHDMARSTSSSSQIPSHPSSSPTTSTPSGKTQQRSSNSTSRKTPRKPVPVYDASTTSLASATAVPVSPFDQTPPESTLGHDAAIAAIYSNGAHGHYATRTNSQPAVDRVSEHELVHKSSFGPGGVEGKQLHYLIPDMPLDGGH